VPPAPPTAPAGAKPAPKKGVSLPGSPALWIGVLAVAVGGAAWLIWKRRQASAASSTDTAGSDVTSADTTGYDQDAGELGTLQSEIGDLQSSEAQSTTGADAPVRVKVPNVVGQPQEAGFAIISAAGLKAVGTAVVPGKVLTVQAQSPAAGALADKGSTVTLQSKVVPAKKAAPPPAKKKAA
jgi:PASTA domain